MPSPASAEYEKYIEVTTKPGTRGEPVIRGKGFPVWSIVGYYLATGGKTQTMIEDYGGELTIEEIDAAMAYYKQHQDVIDAKLRANERVSD